MPRFVTLFLCAVLLGGLVESAPAGLRQELRTRLKTDFEVERVLHQHYGPWLEQADRLSPDLARYLVLKQQGEAIPADLAARLFPPASAEGGRQGGDTPAEAQEIGGLPYTDNGTTAGYTDEAGTNFASPDVFYRFTLEEMNFITISLCTGTNYDSALQVFEDVDGALGASLYFIDDWCGLQSQLSEISLPAGSYYLAVDGFSDASSGDYGLTISEVGNPCEAYNEAIVDLEAPGSLTGTTLGAADIYSGDGGDAGIDVVIPESGLWDFDACQAGSTYDVVLYLFTANPCEGGELLATGAWSDCQVPWGAGRIEEIPLEAGTYHLMASNTWTTTGDFEILVQPTPPRPTQGGPDEMGYTWISSQDPEGPELDWVEASDSGTLLTLMGDDNFVQIELPWEFPFYDFTYSTTQVSTNGYVAFSGNAFPYWNGNLPSAEEPNDAIYALWNDLTVAGTEEAGVFTWHDTENDRFVVEWKNIPRLGQTAPNTFEIILYPDGHVDVQYLELDLTDLQSVTAGLENADGTIGLQVNANGDGGYLGSGVRLYYVPIEGDFRAPMVTVLSMPSDIETELPGPHTVEATITDETGVASAQVHYTINGGTELSVEMNEGANDLWSGDIPHQPANSLVSWWIVAVDATAEQNTRTTLAQSFDVVSYHTAPLNLSATDGLQTGTQISWMPPPSIEVWNLFGGDMPHNLNEALGRLQAAGLDKEQALAVWENWQHPAERQFEGFRLYRDGELLIETTALSFVDFLDNGAEADVVYTYEVSAVFTAGESDLSNADDGFFATAPAEGGPDAFGYIWRNNQSPGGPDFEWVEISGTGTPVPWAGSTDDGFSSALDLGFTLPFYDQFVTSVYVGTNGYLSFGQGYSSLGAMPIPTASDGWSPDNFIAAVWDDLYPGQGGTVTYLADAANQRFIVEFSQVPPYGGGDPFTFQFILNASGVITVAYQDVNENDIAWAGAGIENSTGTIGLQYYYYGEGAAVADGILVSYLPPSNCEPVECAGTQETEPNEGWNDNNASWDLIRCGDTYCGTILANGANVDTDWFLYNHFGGNITVNLEVSDFDGRVSLRQQAVGGQTIASAGTFPRCFDEAFTVSNLTGGSYYIVVEHTGDPDVTTPQTYSLSLTCSGDPCSGHLPVECAGSTEVEPNEGWNGTPPNSSYGEILDSQTLCGSIWAHDGARDMDWYHFHLDAPRSVTFTALVDAFDAALFITDFSPEGSVLAEVNENPACAPETLTLPELPAGDYFIAIGHSNFEGVETPQNYSLVFGTPIQPEDPCDNYVDVGNFHDIYQMARPAPQLVHHDGTGCPTGIASPGRDEVTRLMLTRTTDLQVFLQGEGNADEVILLLGNCAQPSTSCGAAADNDGPGPLAEVLTLNNLPAGDYFLVADFAGPGETHPYGMTIVDMESDLEEGRNLVFQVEPAFPNPFNPSTSISWTQPKLAAATLSVHDMRGALVEELDLGVRGAGRHTAVWDATRFGSGVYFCTLRVGEQTHTLKAVLIK